MSSTNNYVPIECQTCLNNRCNSCKRLPGSTCPIATTYGIIPSQQYDPWQNPANQDYILRAKIDADKTEYLSGIKKREAEDLAIFRENLGIEKSAAGCSVELNANGCPIASFDRIQKDTLKKPLINAQIKCIYFSFAYPSKQDPFLAIALTRPGALKPVLIRLSEDEFSGKVLLEKLKRQGFTVLTSSHRKKDLLDALLATLIEKAPRKTIPARHGWFKDDNIWKYSNEVDASWEVYFHA